MMRTDPATKVDSAGRGAGLWLIQRASAIVLIPLSLWAAGSFRAHASEGYEAFVRWLAMPLTAGLVILLLIALFLHMALGLQVVVEDYIKPESATATALVLIRIVCFFCAVAGITAVLVIAV